MAIVWYAINITAWLVSGVMLLIAVTIKNRTPDDWDFLKVDFNDIDWANSGEAFASFPPSAIVLIAATAITLGVIVWAIAWLARQGEPGQNRFGPDPRA